MGHNAIGVEGFMDIRPLLAEKVHHFFVGTVGELPDVGLRSLAFLNFFRRFR